MSRSDSAFDRFALGIVQDIQHVLAPGIKRAPRLTAVVLAVVLTLGLLVNASLATNAVWLFTSPAVVTVTFLASAYASMQLVWGYRP